MIKNIQRNITKYLPDLYNLPYTERFEHLHQNTWDLGRWEDYLVILYKMVYNMVQGASKVFELILKIN